MEKEPGYSINFLIALLMETKSIQELLANSVLLAKTLTATLTVSSEKYMDMYIEFYGKMQIS